jgi:hypothetical protein
MTTTYEKINNDTLKVTRNDTDIHTFEKSRAEIQTEIDHLKLNKSAISEKIDALEALIAILDEE